jgi:hypothetical protein
MDPRKQRAEPEDLEAFMTRWVRARAVAPPSDPLGLSREDFLAWRRTMAPWHEVCLEMIEFFQNLMHARLVDSHQTRRLAELSWILTQATWVFSVRDPTFRAEQERYIQLCHCVAATFFAAEDETGEALQEMCGPTYGLAPAKWLALAEALTYNSLQGWKDWRHAERPNAWVRVVARQTARDHCPLPTEVEPMMVSLDALSPTGDSYAALIPELGVGQLQAEIHAQVDLTIACQREQLMPETSRWLLGRYNGVSRSVASELLGLSEQDLGGAVRQLQSALPALRARLTSYLPKRSAARKANPE